MSLFRRGFGRMEKPLWVYNTDDTVFEVCFSPDNSLIAVGSGSGNLYVLDYAGNCLWMYKTEVSIQGGISFSADGSLIAVGSCRKGVYLFTREGKLLWSFKTKGWVFSVNISSDGSVIAAGSDDGKLYLFDRSGELLWCEELDDSVRGISLPADASVISAGVATPQQKPSKMYLFNRSGKLLWSQDTKGPIIDTCISADGTLIATHSAGEVYLFNREGELLSSNKLGLRGSCLSLSSDGSLLAVGITGVENWRICLLNRTGKLLWSHKTVGVVRQVFISNKNVLIAAVSHNHHVRTRTKAYLFNHSGKLLWSYETKTGNAFVSVSISPDGSLLAIGSTDNGVYLFDVKRFK